MIEDTKIGNEKYIQTIGSKDIFAFNRKKWMRKYLSNILHVSELSFNLFSILQLLTRDYLAILQQNMHIQKE